MSYILDALKKSESERQRQNAPGFSDVPAHTTRTGTPGWMWLLLGLLLMNAVILGGFLLRGMFASSTTTVENVVSQPLPPPAAVRSNPGNSAPARDIPTAAPAEPPASEAKRTPPVRTPVRTAATPANDAVARKAPTPTPSTGSAGLPTLLDLSAEGVLQLPELHLDVHVYSQAPQDRFVFINMSKYREAARLADGPLVREIVPDGVILEYDGNTFLLPRD